MVRRSGLVEKTIAARLYVSPALVSKHMTGGPSGLVVPRIQQVQRYLEELPHGGVVLDEVVDCYGAWPRRELVFPSPYGGAPRPASRPEGGGERARR